MFPMGISTQLLPKFIVSKVDFSEGEISVSPSDQVTYKDHSEVADHF